MPELGGKLLIIIGREYLQRVRSKAFRAFTLLFPAIMIGYLMLIMALSRSAGQGRYRLAVMDLSGKLYAPLQRELGRARVNGRPQFRLVSVAATPATISADSARLEAAVLAHRYNGFLLLPADILQRGRASYHARTVTDLFLLNRLQAALRAAVSRARLAAAGVAPQVAGKIMQPLRLQQLKITAAGERADQGQTFVLAYVLGGMLYIVLVFYGIRVMLGVIEEKTNRTAEVVLSSMDTETLMLGKLLGIGAAGLTQFAIWLVFLALLASYGLVTAHFAGAPSFLSQIPHIPAFTYAALVMYFVLGFLLYAAMYAAVGASVSNTEEAQQMQIPITLLLVAAFIIVPIVLTNPSGLRAVVLSEIPFFAPVLMILRLTAAPPPAWQVGLSWLLMAATAWLLIRFAAKIYRVGILMTGKRPNLPELLRWLRAG